MDFILFIYWLIYLLFKVANAIEEMTLLGSYDSQHKESASSSIERDNSDSSIIQTWIHKHNPFTTSKKLICLDSGFINENNKINCVKAEMIGAFNQNSLDNRIFSSCSFKRKRQITNLQSLHSSVTIYEYVAIDLSTLFLQLAVLVDRKPEIKIENCFIMN